ncbi:ABC transporter substrate-binding protein [Piscinibacter sp.]|uniref:ABC transporter substrate-binding protein n=1 Tax=Piscinibacter sp. TaxID=1903157 RepID=UPI0039E54CA5
MADLRIGVILSLTGPAASLGIPARNSVELWPREVGGQKVQVIVLDDASDPTGATLAARKLTSESKVDVLVGPSVTPTSLAALQVAGETSTPMISLAGSGAIVSPLEGPKKWAFKMPPEEHIPLKMIFDRMKRDQQTRLGIVAMSNAYGQTFLDVAQRMAPAAGVQIVGVERYGATDQSFVSQALKLLGAKPDAVLIAAAGTPAAMPHIELRNRGFGGTIYQTQAVANNDFLRVGGASVNGSLMPVSPLLVAEQLPESHPVRGKALAFVNSYEAKHGAGSRSLFGGMAWDAMLLLQAAVPEALRKAQPGTNEFREALRAALENTGNLVLTQGVYSMSATDHNGADERSQVMVRIDDGKWKYADR